MPPRRNFSPIVCVVFLEEDTTLEFPTTTSGFLNTSQYFSSMSRFRVPHFDPWYEM